MRIEKLQIDESITIIVYDHDAKPAYYQGMYGKRRKKPNRKKQKTQTIDWEQYWREKNNAT